MLRARSWFILSHLSGATLIERDANGYRHRTRLAGLQRERRLLRKQRQDEEPDINHVARIISGISRARHVATPEDRTGPATTDRSNGAWSFLSYRLTPLHALSLISARLHSREQVHPRSVTHNSSYLRYTSINIESDLCIRDSVQVPFWYGVRDVSLDCALLIRCAYRRKPLRGPTRTM